MLDHQLGDITSSSDGDSIRIERTLRRPIETVWESLTVSDRMAEWWHPAEVELSPGGHLLLTSQDSGMKVFSAIIEVEPPRLLVHSWPAETGEGSKVRWELTEVSEGTRLVLTHFEIDDGGTIYYAAGWHLHLDLLEEALEHEPVPYSQSAWEALFARYESAGTKVSG